MSGSENCSGCCAKKRKRSVESHRVGSGCHTNRLWSSLPLGISSCRRWEAVCLHFPYRRGMLTSDSPERPCAMSSTLVITLCPTQPIFLTIHTHSRSCALRYFSSTLAMFPIREPRRLCVPIRAKSFPKATQHRQVPRLLHGSQRLPLRYRRLRYSGTK